MEEQHMASRARGQPEDFTETRPGQRSEPGEPFRDPRELRGLALLKEMRAESGRDWWGALWPHQGRQQTTRWI